MPQGGVQGRELSRAAIHNTSGSFSDALAMPWGTVRPQGGGGKGSWNKVLCRGKRDHNLFSEAKLKQKDSSWLQTVCEHSGETQELITPLRHVPTKQNGDHI